LTDFHNSFTGTLHNILPLHLKRITTLTSDDASAETVITASHYNSSPLGPGWTNIKLDMPIPSSV